MVRYLRPRLPQPVFRDAAGAVIEYGRRWRGGSPPEETYSVSAHPERFAPLHTVADALIEYLLRQYDASALDDLAASADLMSARDDIVRAVRVTPATTEAAPLTFVFTGYPGLVVHAGLLRDFHFPDCGCDACDESVEAVADDLEATVMAVVEGRYQETFEAGTRELPPGRWSALPARLDPDAPEPAILDDVGDRAGFRIVAPDGSSRRGGSTLLGGSIPADRIVAAREHLERLEDGWQPWPLRGANG